MSSAAVPIAEMAPVSREHRPSIVGGEVPGEPFPMQLAGVVTRGFGRGARFLGIPTANLPDASLGPLNDLHLTGIFYGFALVHPSLSTPLPTPSASGTTTPIRAQDHSQDYEHEQDHRADASQTAEISLNPQASRPPPSHTREQPLSIESIQEIRAETAPYPPDSVAGETSAPKRLGGEDGRVWPMVMSVGWNPYFKNEKITAPLAYLDLLPHTSLTYLFSLPPAISSLLSSLSSHDPGRRSTPDRPNSYSPFDSLTKQLPSALSGFPPRRSADTLSLVQEVHIIHPFTHDFYGHDMSVLVLGYIRPELDYISRDALVNDINFDVKVALNSLARPGYAKYARDPFLLGGLARVS